MLLIATCVCEMCQPGSRDDFSDSRPSHHRRIIVHQILLHGQKKLVLVPVSLFLSNSIVDQNSFVFSCNLTTATNINFFRKNQNNQPAGLVWATSIYSVLTVRACMCLCVCVCACVKY